METEYKNRRQKIKDFHQRNLFFPIPFEKVLFCGGFDGLRLLRWPTKLQKQPDMKLTIQTLTLIWNGYRAEITKRDKSIWPNGLRRTEHHILAGSHLSANTHLSSLKNPAVPVSCIENTSFGSFFEYYLKKYASSGRPSSSGMAERWAYLHVVYSSFYLFLWLKTMNEKIMLGQLICSSLAIFQKLDTAQTCESHLSRFFPQEEIH